MLIDPYMSTVTNFVKSVDMHTFARKFEGNSTTANNAGLSGSLPSLDFQYLLGLSVSLSVVLSSDWPCVPCTLESAL